MQAFVPRQWYLRENANTLIGAAMHLEIGLSLHMGSLPRPHNTKCTAKVHSQYTWYFTPEEALATCIYERKRNLNISRSLVSSRSSICSQVNKPRPCTTLWIGSQIKQYNDSCAKADGRCTCGLVSKSHRRTSECVKQSMCIGKITFLTCVHSC